MIQSNRRTDASRPAFVLAVILAAGMIAGFVAGQAAPDVLGSLFRPSTTVESISPQAPALIETDDFGIRHLSTVTLTPADDYGVRHPGQ